MNKRLKKLLSFDDMDMAILTGLVVSWMFAVTAMSNAQASIDASPGKSATNAVPVAVVPATGHTKAGTADTAYVIAEEFDYTTSRPKAVVLEVPASTGSTP